MIINVILIVGSSTAMGVRGINLSAGDFVVGMDIIEEGAYLLVVSEHGYGKRTPVADYRIQTRGGKGILTYKVAPKTGKLVGMKVVKENDEVMLINMTGVVIRLNVNEVSEQGRSTQGVKLMRIGEKDVLVSMAKISGELEE